MIPERAPGVKSGWPKTQIMLRITKNDPEIGNTSSEPKQQPVS